MSINNEVEAVLQNITEKGSHIKFNDYVNAVNYDVVLRTKLNEGDSLSQQCDNWIQKFSAITNSKWIVKNTAPSAVRILYKKSYACKDKKCDARIIIVFKKDNRNTRRNDPLIAKGLTTVIKVKFKHNHEVYCPPMNCCSNPRIDNMLIAQADICKRSLLSVTPEEIKCEANIEGFSSASETSEPDCMDMADSKDKFIDLQFECTEYIARTQITKFKCELERILTIVEGTKSIEIIHCMENLNKSLQMITTPQQFYDKFSKLLT